MPRVSEGRRDERSVTAETSTRTDCAAQMRPRGPSVSGVEWKLELPGAGGNVDWTYE